MAFLALAFFLAAATCVGDREDDDDGDEDEDTCSLEAILAMVEGGGVRRNLLRNGVFFAAEEDVVFFCFLGDESDSEWEGVFLAFGLDENMRLMIVCFLGGEEPVILAMDVESVILCLCK